MRSMHNKILAALLACTLLMLGGCFKGKGGGGGGGNQPQPKTNWDSIVWDQDKWQ